MSKNVNVTVIENGPLKIPAGATVSFCGERIALEEGKDLYLCRCGESSNAPFCDGSHSKVGFVAEPGDVAKKEVRVWEGKTIKTFFNPNACMHVFYCKPLGDLRERELAGDEDAAAEIMKVVRSCPSGALSYEATAADEIEAQGDVDIDIIEGGEIRIQCNFEINSETHERQATDRGTLCRCGLSKNKPWCDGRHKKREDFR